MKTIRWGMIGCGDVTEVKNGPGLYLAEHSELVGVTNRTLSKAEDWVKRHGHGRVFESVEALLACQEIDSIYIATTPDKHMEYAILCARAGKHCLIEKPLALTYKEGLAIEEAFKQAGKKAFVAFYRRSLNRFRKIKALLEEEVIGSLQGVKVTRAVKPVEEQAAWRIHSNISGGGIFTETDIHILDFLEYCLGPIKSCKFIKQHSQMVNPDLDAVSLSLSFDKGVIGSGLWLYHCYVTKDEVEFIGSKGIISFSFFNNEKPIKILTAEGEKEIIIEDSKHVGLNMQQEIVDELNGIGSFSGTVSASLNALRLAEEVYYLLDKSRQQQKHSM